MRQEFVLSPLLLKTKIKTKQKNCIGIPSHSLEWLSLRKQKTTKAGKVVGKRTTTNAVSIQGERNPYAQLVGM
jgi:hypothetical protein